MFTCLVDFTYLSSSNDIYNMCMMLRRNAKLRNFAMTVGTRDSRKIIGRYNLTAQDVCNQARFEDAVGIFPEFIDGYNILILPTTGRFFQVPYGCMLPSSGAENLLVAGRAVAGDRTSHAAMRNMMACTVTGQAAGVAAAVSIRQKVLVSGVPAGLALVWSRSHGFSMWFSLIPAVVASVEPAGEGHLKPSGKM